MLRPRLFLLPLLLLTVFTGCTSTQSLSNTPTHKTTPSQNDPTELEHVAYTSLPTASAAQYISELLQEFGYHERHSFSRTFFNTDFEFGDGYENHHILVFITWIKENQCEVRISSNFHTKSQFDYMASKLVPKPIAPTPTSAPAK